MYVILKMHGIFFTEGSATLSNDEKRCMAYEQLKDYIISANEQKMQNTFRYKMLIEKKKTAIEFWLTDSLMWPLLQKVTVTFYIKVLQFSS